MRIAYVSEVWEPAINGVVTRLRSTIDGLLAAGHEVLVVAPRMPGAPHHEQEGRLRIVRVPAFRVSWVYGGQPWGLPSPAVGRALAPFAPDLVHVVSPFTIGIAGVLWAKRHRVPLVASFHTDIALYAGSYHLGWSRPIIWRIIAALHNAAAVNLVTSEHSRQLFAEHRVRNVVLWRRGVDLERFQPGGREARPDNGRIVALYVGRLADEKGLRRLLPLARSADVELRIVGDGPDRVALEAAFAGTGAVFVGPLRGDDVAREYQRADAFVFTSTTETLGLVLIEAMACGVPVVAVDSPASRELLAHVPVARLVPTDAPERFRPLIDEVLAVGDPAERSRLARREALEWGWSGATEQVIDIYRGLVQPASTADPSRTSALQ
ncbi:glycosyltransferase family 4 protein [Curtobacterium ammoniigenes]|uniref:glycosyltransferase family 4 protein n=1 Tax=Curtobacterium ammoniigenes TaxID=395387 RepID=UPI00082E415E|nr:glycosyltransferase family 1 protein [Curtobacterium ammoniigenes]